MEFFQNVQPTEVRQFLEALETMHSGLNVTCEKGGDAMGDWWIVVARNVSDFPLMEVINPFLS